MRTRTRGILTPVTRQNVISVWGSSNPVINNPVAFTVEGSTETFTDIVTPGWKAARRTGTCFNNPMTSIKTTWLYSRGANHTSQYTRGTPSTGQYWKQVTNGYAVGTSSLPSGMPSIDVQSLIKQAATSCRSKVESPSAFGIPFVAEFPRLIESIRHPLLAARKAVEKWSRGKVRGSAKDLADQHLEIIYGLIPAINDIQDAIKVFNARARPKRITARGSATGTSSKVVTTVVNQDDAAITVVTSAQVQVKVRAFSFYEPKVEMSISDQLGFRLVDIPSAGWELTPFSFVVDWFTNLGILIQALEPRVGISYLAEGTTITTTTNITQQVVSATTSPAFVGFGWTLVEPGGGDTVVYTRIEKVRTPGSLGPKVGLAYKNRFALGQLLASISLITQRLDRR